MERRFFKLLSKNLHLLELFHPARRSFFSENAFVKDWRNVFETSLDFSQQNQRTREVTDLLGITALSPNCSLS